MIEPTIGRKVWYHPNLGAGDPPPIVADQPYDASIVAVYSATIVSLAVWNHSGHWFPKEKVTLAQDDVPVEAGMAQWMPFQVGQAKKHSDEDEAKLLSGNLSEFLDALAIRVDALEAAFKDVQETVKGLSTPAAPPKSTGSATPSSERLDVEPPPLPHPEENSSHSG